MSGGEIVAMTWAVTGPLGSSAVLVYLAYREYVRAYRYYCDTVLVPLIRKSRDDASLGQIADAGAPLAPSVQARRLVRRTPLTGPKRERRGAA